MLTCSGVQNRGSVSRIHSWGAYGAYVVSDGIQVSCIQDKHFIQLCCLSSLMGFTFCCAFLIHSDLMLTVEHIRLVVPTHLVVVLAGGVALL